MAGYREEDSDMDAEHEEDVDMAHAEPQSGLGAHKSDTEGSDADAEGEEIDEEEDAGEPVGAVKIAHHHSESEEEDEDAEIEASSDAKSSEDEDDSSSSESDAENEWQGESDSSEDAEAEISNPNQCIFCGEDEEHDPSEEYEEYLACAVCGDNAHRQCARNANSLRADDEAEHWRCTTCFENGLEEDVKEKTESTSRRRSSVNRMTKDLLPAGGTDKPDSHSVFNTLIDPDDPMDGSRNLRKRKAGSAESEDEEEDEEEEEPPARPSRKRRRPSEPSSSDGESERSAKSPPPDAAQPAASRRDHGHVESASEVEGRRETRSSRPRRSRSRRADRPLVRIVSEPSTRGLQLIVAFRPDSGRMQKILASKPKKKRVRDRSKKVQTAPASPEMSHYPSIQTNFHHSFFSFHDRDHDEAKQKPYGGILSEAEADTSRTFPQAPDRKRFEDARQTAEEDWKKKMAAGSAPEEKSRPSHKVSGLPSKIKCINFGGYEIDTWHAAPYPEEYSRNKVLYICEFCLKYMNSDYVAWRHKLKCPAKHPPGDEIYRDGRYSFFEVDGRKNPVYCQNLCLLAKLFLGSKTLYYDVEPFLFYVMTETDEYGCHFVGYFSKEKRPSSLNNVSCILVLPIHQRKGFGHMLIEFSYLLTRVEKKTGSPEKPLSDMGLVSYRSYWRLVLCYQLLNQTKPISIADISERTGMTADDIVSGLEGLRALVRDPHTKSYALRLDYAYFKQYIDKFETKRWPKINQDALVWTPYVMNRSINNYDDGPPLHTVAQREDGEDCTQPEEGVQLALQQNGDDANSPSKQDGSVGADPAPGSVDAKSKASDMPTPTDDGNGKDNLLAPATPVPYATRSISHSPSKASNPPTPLPNGTAASVADSAAQSSCPRHDIPPTRFEVFPPIPGTSARRRPGRPGRPFGSRRRTATPVRPGGKNLVAPNTAPVNGLGLIGTLNSPSPLLNTPVPLQAMARRTRSKLGEVLTPNGIQDEEAGKKGEGMNGPDSENASSNGKDGADGSQDPSPTKPKPKPMHKGKGKGKAVVQVVIESRGKKVGIMELEEDVDDDGDDDVDGEGDVIMGEA